MPRRSRVVPQGGGVLAAARSLRTPTVRITLHLSLVSPNQTLRIQALDSCARWCMGTSPQSSFLSSRFQSFGGTRPQKWLEETAKSLQLCPTLCDPTDGSPPGSPVPGILQARTLEWIAISFSNAWKWKVKVKSLSHVWLLATPWTTAYQAPPSMGFSRHEYWSGVPLPSPAWRKAHFYFWFSFIPSLPRLTRAESPITLLILENKH